MLTRRNSFSLTLVACLTLPPLAAAGPAPEKDRAAILAMAGDFRVRFDMRETVSFQPGYETLDDKVSGGYESVRVAEDRGDVISLQHILVVEHDGEASVVKHWRQDWTYEPKAVLVYEQAHRWVLKDVPAAARKGAWSQTVWQTDDSPRYGGVGGCMRAAWRVGRANAPCGRWPAATRCASRSIPGTLAGTAMRSPPPAGSTSRTTPSWA